MVNNQVIEQAIDDLKSQEAPNISQTAQKYGIARRTLSHRFHQETTSYQESRSLHQMLLSNAQEEVLLQHISDLTDLGLPPTPQILQNLVVEIVRRPIGEKWI